MNYAQLDITRVLIALVLCFCVVSCTGPSGNPGEDDGIAYVEPEDPGSGDFTNGDGDCIPTGDEVCDGRDNDCDGMFDDADADLDLSTAVTWYVDEDGDGYGDSETALLCETYSGEGYARNEDDCDDSDPQIFPGAPERCTATDDNCDGQLDDSGLVSFISDADGSINDLSDDFQSSFSNPFYVEMSEDGKLFMCAGDYFGRMRITARVDIVGAGSEKSRIVSADTSETMIVYDNPLSIAPMTLSGFTLTSDTRALFAEGVSDLRIEDVTFRDNNANRTSGTAMRIGSSNISASDVSFVDNLSYHGGAIYIFGRSELSLSNCIFQENYSSLHGGAIYIQGSTVSVDGCRIEGNESYERGGAIYMKDNSELIVQNSALIGNTTRLNDLDTRGGAIYGIGSRLTIENTSITDNRAPHGGGLFLEQVETNLKNVTFSGNYTINTTSFYSGSRGDGGAVRVIGAEDFTMVGGGFTDNEAVACGGAICATDTDVFLSGLTVEDNISSGHGGDFSYQSSRIASTLTVEDSSIGSPIPDTVYLRAPELSYDFSTAEGAVTSFECNTETCAPIVE